jgi:hypothetical protein
MLDSRRLQDALWDLLAGVPVASNDNGVQISCYRMRDNICVLRVRDSDPSFKFLLEITIRALTESEVARIADFDQAGVASPLPDAWCKVNSETSQTWELYNCSPILVHPVEV